MIKIWGRRNSVNVQKVLWAADELGLEWERIDAGGEFGGLETEAYDALNPNRRIPTIEDGETVVWESNVIVRYLARKYGAGTLWPEDPKTGAHAEMWMDWVQTTLILDMNVVFWGLVRTPPEGRDNRAERYYRLDCWRPVLPELEAWLGRLRERPPFQAHLMQPLT